MAEAKERIRILVVDDEKIITMHLEELLTNMDYDIVGTASTGAEAIEKARELKPDLIFMDIIMPGEMTGIDAATEIKNELRIPVIYLTAFADDHIIEKAKLSDPFNFIVKPFKGHELRAAIEIAIYRKKMEKALEESEEKYRTLVEESRDGIAIIQDGIFKYLNPALMDMLKKPKDIDETFFLYYFMEDCREHAEELYYKGIEGNDIPSINEFSLTRGDGSYLPVETNATKINFQGKPAMLSFFRSMKERKTIENMLDYMVQEINERNQITIPNIEKLMTGTKDKKLKKQLETVHSLLFDNANTIKKAYKLLQMDNGRKELLFADPIDKLNEAINAITRQYPEREIKVNTHIHGTAPVVLADEFLEDAFYILFEHAVRNLEEDPLRIDVTINVKGKKGKECVEIRIQDNSHTHSSEEKERAFEPFSIPKENTTIGSGLSIVKSILDRFSGEIRIEDIDKQDPESDTVVVLNLKTKQNYN